MNLQPLFEQVKITGDWSALYPHLQVVAGSIGKSLRLPTVAHDDMLQQVLANALSKLPEINHVGYLLKAIRYEGIRLSKKEAYERKCRRASYDEVLSATDGIRNHGQSD